MTRPLCFVLMPAGRTPDTGGRTVDFDRVYAELLAPAIEAAGLEPLRGDEALTGDVIHTPALERLVLCEYAVADLTTAHANVFYQLGLRHAIRRAATVMVFAEGSRQLPLDMTPLRALRYPLASDGGPDHVHESRQRLTERLEEAREGGADSPVFQLVDGFPDIQRLKTDVFRERVHYSSRVKGALAEARHVGVDAVRAIDTGLGPLVDVESGVLIDLFLSYRAVKAWPDMIALVDRMPRPLAATAMVREQLGLALNRVGQGERAEQVLKDLIAERGPSSESYGILGRVYKDRWEAAVRSGPATAARPLLEQAIAAYLRGFESDWRDAYPGVNAVTLMELRTPPDPRRTSLVPVVRYAVERRIAGGRPDYWDYATLLELAILATDQEGAGIVVDAALAHVRERWEPETTARNLRLIREARAARGEAVAWADEIERLLTQAGEPPR